MSEIQVKTGQWSVSKDPDVLVSLGIGSCVAVCFYDNKNKIGGLAHIMLPSHQNTNVAPLPEAEAQYAGDGIDAVLAKMLLMGCEIQNIKAKIAGGSEMFSNLRLSPQSLGSQNVMSVKTELSKHRVALLSEDTGGHVGRSLWFYLDSGEIEIKKRM